MKHQLAYLSQVRAARMRFALAGESNLKFAFSWTDALDPTSRRKVIYDRLEMEEAAVLYNISTAHSYIASQCDVSSVEGLKAAALHFQFAAGTK